MRRTDRLSLALGFVAFGCGADDAAVIPEATSESGDTSASGSTSTVPVTGETGSSGASGNTPIAECGNGILELGEDCDDGKDGDNEDACTDLCTAPFCGDGFVQLGALEHCDPGGVDNEHCTAGCTATHKEAWTRTYAGPAGGHDYAQDVAIDADGNVIAVGTIYVGDQGTDIWLRKYDPDGNELWTRTHDGANPNSGDVGAALAIRDDGHIFVTGLERPGGSADDIWLAAYDPDGIQEWSTTWMGEMTANEAGSDIALAPDDSIVVVGYTFFDTIEAWYGKFDAAGNEQWVRKAGGSTEFFDQAVSLDIDESGRIVVAGTVNDDVWVRTVQPDGTEIWTVTFHAISEFQDIATGVAFDGDGNVLVLGSSRHVYLRKFDAQGQEMWTKIYEDESAFADHLVVADDGSMLIAGTRTLFENSWVAFLRKLSADGEVLWVQTYGDATVVSGGLGTAVRGDTIAFAGREFTGLTGNDLWVRAYRP